MDKSIPIRVAIITCAYDRPMIFKLFLKWFLFLKEETKTKFDLHLYCGGSADDYFGECKRIFYSVVGDSATWVECPNEPLGNKWNKTLLSSKYFNFDYFLILGSDDFMSVSLFNKYYEYVNSNYNFFGIKDFYLLDIKTFQTKLFEGYDNDYRDKSLGCGRFLSKKIVEKNNYKLWNDVLNSGLDFSMDKNLDNTEGISKKILSCLPDEFAIIGIKSEVNLWKFSSYKGIVVNAEHILFNHFTEDFYKNMKYIYCVKNNIHQKESEFLLLKTKETYSLSQRVSNDFIAEFKSVPLPQQKTLPSVMPQQQNVIQKPVVITRHLDILIPSLRKREKYFMAISKKVQCQINFLKLQSDIKIIERIDDGKLSIGFKRNWLMEQSPAKYVMFLDDDDDVHSDYIKEIYEATKLNPDVVTFNGTVYFNGANPQGFNSNIEYREYKNENGMFMRPPGHLNAIKREIAIKYKFKEFDKINDRASDVHYAMEMVRDIALKSVVHIDKPLYIYRRKL